MQLLSEKVAVVTGAGGGIGRGHARLLADEGARVALVLLALERTDSTAIGGLLVAVLLAVGRRRGSEPAAIGDTPLGRMSNNLLGILGVLFVPAGVGVIREIGPLGEHWLALAAALLVSSILTLIVTAWVFMLVSRLVDRRARDGKG